MRAPRLRRGRPTWPGRQQRGPSRGGWATTSRIASSGTAGCRAPATAWSRCVSKPGAPGPGQARTFASDTTDITPANPIDSLDWADYVAAVAHTASEQAVDDVVQR